MRKYELDWLRVIVFGLLIFYHVGMFFVPWGFHIKNNVIYDELVWPMRFVNQWRLPILFVISGMGTYFALSKRTGWQFAGERLKRLFIPLVFGMLVVVPPQVYFERMADGEFSGGYFDFWPSQAFIEGNLTWNHLWFLPYLLIYSLLLIPAFLYFRKHPDNSFFRWLSSVISLPFGLYVFLVPIYLVYTFVRPFFPVTHALTDDWFTFFNYLMLFFFGFVLMGINKAFWPAVQQNRKTYGYIALLTFTIYALLHAFVEHTVAMHFIRTIFKVTYLWSSILTLFGYATTYLNKNSPFLKYSNEAVYPLYILHQTVTITIGYYLMDLDWGFWSKASIMTAGTFGVSLLLYEFVIRRLVWLRPFFGLKVK